MHRTPWALALLALVVASCSDNPVTPEEHFEARGVILRLADSTIVTVDSNRVAGTLRLDTSAAGRTYTLAFILEDGTIEPLAHEHDHDADEEELELDVRVADTTVARVAAIDSHGSTVTIAGLREGATTLTVHLLHGGHDDFVSPAVPVVVAP